MNLRNMRLGSMAFHPMSTYNDAHRCATSYFRSEKFMKYLQEK